MDSDTGNEGEHVEDGGQQDVPLAWGEVGGNQPPPPPDSALPSVEPPAVVQPWAEQAAAANPLRNPSTPPLGQSIGATPPVPPQVPPPVPPQISQPLSQMPPMPPSAGQQTVVSSAAEPVLSSDYGVTSPPVAPDVSSSGSKLPWIAALVGALMLLGGGGFFALTAFTSSGGAETPEAAVDSMFEALGNEDFVTLGELIEPGERRTIVEPSITELLPELKRLGILSDEADAGGVDGIDLEFTDLTYRVDPIADNPDMVHVYLTGGEVASEFNAAEFPFTDEYREILGSDLQDEPRTVEPIENSDSPLTFVQRDGRWYFSGWFTIAEIARLDEGARLPLASEAPPALGSESPEAAVEAMMAEIVELDMAGMIGRMDPEELAALYRYSPLFLEEGQDGLDEVRQFLNDENVSWDVRDFDFDVNTDGDDAIVEVRGFTFEVTAPQVDLTMTYGREAVSATVIADQGQGSFEASPTRWVIEGVVDGESFNIEILIDPEAGTVTGTGTVAGESGNGELIFDETGVCSRYSISIAGETESGCLEENADTEEADLISNYETVFEQWPTEFPGIAISTRRTDGEWYVSPVSTMFDGMLSVLSGFEEGQLQELTDSGMGLDPLSGADDLSDIIEDAVDSSMGNDETVTSAADSIDDQPVFGVPEVESTIAFTVDRGASAELSDSISVGTYDSATLDLEAGDTVIITMTAADSSLDPHLSLIFEGSGNIVGTNDDADFEADLPSSFDSQIEIVVDDTGTYEIQIGSYEGESGGDYNLTVTRS